jgi:hypothetical protein
VVVYTTFDSLIGWRFSEDPKVQAQTYHKVIGKSDHTVCQKLQQRSFDKCVFKYVGVSQVDQPGIIQVELKGKEILKYQGGTGKVFSIISQEIRLLSKNVRKSRRKFLPGKKILKGTCLTFPCFKRPQFTVFSQ